jgi:hypothetical protein
MRRGITLWGFALGYREAVDLAVRIEAAGFDNLCEGIARLAAAGVEWITLGPQAVGPESLAQQAERMIASMGIIRSP